MKRSRLFTVGGALLLALLGASGCARQGTDTVVLVTVRLGAPSLAGRIHTLRVTLDTERQSATRAFQGQDGGPLRFPTTYTMQIARHEAGPFRLEILGVDAEGSIVARAAKPKLEIVRGRQVTTEISLDCFGTCVAMPDAGAPAETPDAGPAQDAPDPQRTADMSRSCGNGVLDRGELCDPAVATGLPGACPTTCDDGIACTLDTRVGFGCLTTCTHTEIRLAFAGDRCCPAEATRDTDPDCSATCGNGLLEAGEVCDLAIPAGRPGACPTAQTCVDSQACTQDLLVAANTCSAQCSHQTTTQLVSGDGCCPAGATNATDTDCPIVCGNGLVEAPNELCDTAIAAGTRGSCPTPAACDDKDPCTLDIIEGAGCRAVCRRLPLTQLTSGDGCCPSGATRSVDSDCAPVCGNGVVEPGEQCDRMIAEGMPGGCPTTCTAATDACMTRVLEGEEAACTTRCSDRPKIACGLTKDGCCPAGCTAALDADCSTTCGDGRVDPGESCDTAIETGRPGACPRACDDGQACTTDTLLSGGTCHARCAATVVTAFVTGDRCCPKGANALLDADCAPICGNQLAEGPREACDRAIAAGAPGACPTDCPAIATCMRGVLIGDAATCSARCGVEQVRACLGGDGCCPAGCNGRDDSDCPAVCGNGVLEAGEACDRARTAGAPGACAAVCDDRNACTLDLVAGRPDDCTRRCTFSEIKSCVSGDRCCPMGCTPESDRDCAQAMCGNGHVEAGETCDPPGTCPTVCPDDGDPCTRDVVVGDAARCSAACVHDAIAACSGSTMDRCCPTGCSANEDTDCPAAPAPARP